MKKLLTSPTAFALIGGTFVNASGLTQLKDKIPAPYIEPGTPTAAQAEANKLNYKTVTLNETKDHQYFGKTANADATAIKQVLVDTNILSPNIVNDFSFDNTKILGYKINYSINFTVKNKTGLTASGTFDIKVNQPLQVSPTTLNPSTSKKETPIGPSNPKASTIGPSNPKAKTINPSKPIASEDAEDIANKLFGQTIKIDTYFWVGKDISNYQSQFNAAIVAQGVLTKDEVKYVTWAHLAITKADYFWQGGHFTVKKAGATATGVVTVNAANIDSAQDIADKLSGQTINLDPNYWFNKNIKNYSQQLKNVIQYQKLLTADELKYVSWGDLTLNQWDKEKNLYPNCDFTVTKNGQTATAHNISLKLSNLNEDAGTIANKFNQKTVYLDPSYWVGKNIINYATQFKQLLADQQIMNLEESRYVNLNSFAINQPIKYYDNNINVTKDNIGTTTSLTISVLPDTAQNIANKLSNKTVRFHQWKFWFNQDIASYNRKVDQMLVKQHLLTKDEAKDVKWNSLVINWYQKYSATASIMKDGQTWQIVNVTIDATLNPHFEALNLESVGIIFLKNYNWWLGKNLADYPEKIRPLLYPQGLIPNKSDAAWIYPPDLTISFLTSLYDHEPFWVIRNGQMWPGYLQVDLQI